VSTIKLNKGGAAPADTTERILVPTDMYRVKCIEAALEDDIFGKPDKQGNMPQKIKTVWEIVKLTPEQEEAAEEAEQEWLGVRLWHRFNPYYGPVKAGGPSKFQEFIDLVRGLGHLPDFDLEAFDVESLVGLELKGAIALYTKTMGENTGKPGNKITAFAGLKPAKKQPKPRTDEGDDLF
jgi:hypothetical protein